MSCAATLAGFLVVDLRRDRPGLIGGVVDVDLRPLLAVVALVVSSHELEEGAELVALPARAEVGEAGGLLDPILWACGMPRVKARVARVAVFQPGGKVPQVLALPLESAVPTDMPAEEAAERLGHLDLDIEAVPALSTNAFEAHLRGSLPESGLQSAAGHLQASIGNGLFVGLEVEAIRVEVIAILISERWHRVEKSLCAPEPE